MRNQRSFLISRKCQWLYWIFLWIRNWRNRNHWYLFYRSIRLMKAIFLQSNFATYENKTFELKMNRSVWKQTKMPKTIDSWNQRARERERKFFFIKYVHRQCRLNKTEAMLKEKKLGGQEQLSCLTYDLVFFLGQLLTTTLIIRLMIFKAQNKYEKNLLKASKQISQWNCESFYRQE